MYGSPRKCFFSPPEWQSGKNVCAPRISILSEIFSTFFAIFRISGGPISRNRRIGRFSGKSRFFGKKSNFSKKVDFFQFSASSHGIQALPMESRLSPGNPGSPQEIAGSAGFGPSSSESGGSQESRLSRSPTGLRQVSDRSPTGLPADANSTLQRAI